ncbi:MAG: hypothetical protein KDM63_02495 [Verrucomicrobiae bacterium]|nr:hypothetical protein [Verrucomicrobiae bacterium]
MEPAPSAILPETSIVIQESRWKRVWRWVISTLEWGFGLVAILIGLAVLSVIPILNFLSLGYLLEASGRVAATGKIRRGFVGVRKASVVGGIALGVGLALIPVQIVAGFWRDAGMVSPGSAIEHRWKVAMVLVTLAVIVHVVWACLRGGKLRHFLWPAPICFLKALRRPNFGALLEASGRVGDWFESLRLPYFFWLGFRGFVGAACWLIGPVGILILAGKIRNDGVALLTNLLGAGLLMLVVMYLPFLQANFAREREFPALFRLRQIRESFRRAPIAFWFSLLITLLFALPLYVLKVERIPQAVAWLPAALFVLLIFPARLLTGWAMSRASRREQPRFWLWRWMGRLAALPIVAAYVLFVWLTQYLSWQGSFSLLEQHAFLVPAPLLGL